ncbi:hypothetical protein Agub_g14996, partial [Astrephomene gubernaculifera]
QPYELPPEVAAAVTAAEGEVQAVASSKYGMTHLSYLGQLTCLRGLMLQLDSPSDTAPAFVDGSLVSVLTSLPHLESLHLSTWNLLRIDPTAQALGDFPVRQPAAPQPPQQQPLPVQDSAEERWALVPGLAALVPQLRRRLEDIVQELLQRQQKQQQAASGQAGTGQVQLLEQVVERALFLLLQEGKGAPKMSLPAGPLGKDSLCSLKALGLAVLHAAAFDLTAEHVSAAALPAAAAAEVADEVMSAAEAGAEAGPSEGGAAGPSSNGEGGSGSGGGEGNGAGSGEAPSASGTAAAAAPSLDAAPDVMEVTDTVAALLKCAARAARSAAAAGGATAATAAGPSSTSTGGGGGGGGGGEEGGTTNRNSDGACGSGGSSSSSGAGTQPLPCLPTLPTWAWRGLRSLSLTHWPSVYGKLKEVGPPQPGRCYAVRWDDLPRTLEALLLVRCQLAGSRPPSRLRHMWLADCLCGADCPLPQVLSCTSDLQTLVLRWPSSPEEGEQLAAGEWAGAGAAGGHSREQLLRAVTKLKGLRTLGLGGIHCEDIPSLAPLSRLRHLMLEPSQPPRNLPPGADAAAASQRDLTLLDCLMRLPAGALSGLRTLWLPNWAMPIKQLLQWQQMLQVAMPLVVLRVTEYDVVWTVPTPVMHVARVAAPSSLSATGGGASVSASGSAAAARRWEGAGGR